MFRGKIQKNLIKIFFEEPYLSRVEGFIEIFINELT
jgi:hypothetical protein